MAFQTISVELTGNVGPLTAALRTGAAEVGRFGAATQRAAGTVRGATSGMKSEFEKFKEGVDNLAGRALNTFALRAVGVYAAANAVRRALGDVIGGAVQFDARMRNVNSISGLSEGRFRALSASVLDLSRQLPQSANTLAEGLYDVASAGFQGAAGLQVLTAAATAATAGLSTPAVAAQALTAVLNAYGLSASAAGDVSDTLFQTVNLGVVTFDQLASTLGDVVGTAAGAQVPIAAVGSAIATMTLSGISAAESGTSLNRVLQSLLQPSTSLSAVFKSLGYESGASALQAKGLRGVMEDLRTATGGNVTTLLELFPDIRAARGALALMSDEGRNYARVSGQIDDANARQGATHRALQEQLKSVAAQWELFRNRVKAAAIEAGTALLPALHALLDGLTTLGREGFGAVGDAVKALGPLFHNLAQVGGDLFTIARDLLGALAPLGRVLLGLVAAGVIEGLNTLSGALRAIVDLATHNRAVLAGLATVLTVALIPALLRAAAAAVAFTTSLAAGAYLRALYAIDALRGGIGGLGTALRTVASLQGVAAGGVLAIAAVTAAAVASWSKANAAAREFVSTTTAGFNALDPAKVTATFDALGAAAEKSLALAPKYSGFFGTLRAGFSALTGNLDDTAVKGRDAAQALVELTAKVQNTASNLQTLAILTDLPVEALRKLALAKGIDLSVPFEKAGPAILAVVNEVDSLDAKSGVPAAALSAGFDGAIEKIQAAQQAIADLKDATAKAFAGATDIVATFRIDDKSGSAAGQLAAALKANVALASRFSTDIQAAIARGLDPAFVTRLLQAGPQAAGPILQTLVADHSGRLIGMVNASEAALSKISEQVVRIAQFTATATNAALSEQARLAHELPGAIALQQALFAKGAQADIEAFKRNFHLTGPQVKAIATDFGIVLPPAIAATLAGKPVPIPFRAEVAALINQARTGAVTAAIRAEGAVGAYLAAHPIPLRFSVDVEALTNQIAAGGATAAVRAGFASGGYITGPGNGTSDSIPAWLSTGEYVANAAAVRKYGRGVFDALNKMTLPVSHVRAAGYAEGGPVLIPLPRVPVSGPTVVVVTGRDRVERRTEINIGEVRAHDYREFRRQLRDEAELRALRGR